MGLAREGSMEQEIKQEGPERMNLPGTEPHVNLILVLRLISPHPFAFPMPEIGMQTLLISVINPLFAHLMLGRSWYTCASEFQLQV